MRLSRTTSHHRFKLAAAVAALTLVAAMSALASSAQACSYSGAKQAFSQWGDRSNYVLAPDGGFEAGGSGWSLSSGATVVAGNESYYLNGTGDSKSLSLPAGSS